MLEDEGGEGNEVLELPDEVEFERVDVARLPDRSLLT